jgi:hypothetical protein
MKKKKHDLSPKNTRTAVKAMKTYQLPIYYTDPLAVGQANMWLRQANPSNSNRTGTHNPGGITS